MRAGPFPIPCFRCDSCLPQRASLLIFACHSVARPPLLVPGTRPMARGPGTRGGATRRRLRPGGGRPPPVRLACSVPAPHEAHQPCSFLETAAARWVAAPIFLLGKDPEDGLPTRRHHLWWRVGFARGWIGGQGSRHRLVSVLLRVLVPQLWMARLAARCRL